jgi:hypothetical protein
MLTEKDQQFIVRWEKVRDQEATLRHKFLSGLPMAIMFGLPVLLFFGMVQIFLPSWFTEATVKSNEVVVPEMTGKFMKLSSGDVLMIVIAIIILILFFAYFRMHYKWEMNEQLYKELRSKQKKMDDAAL